ncbi:MAG: DUF1549 domain-containing protein [Planctomycetes bacterium]|nr:DUF1549 domain-containing protein [Planctomycetota bacterium]
MTVRASAGQRVSFLRDVMPWIHRRGCNATACHGSQDGKGALKLSLLGAYPEQDHEALARAGAGKWIDVQSPKESLLLKSTAAGEHGGRPWIQVGSAEQGMLEAWIAQGAPWKAEGEAEIASIEAFPEESRLAKGEVQRVLVTAVYADGTRRDVTRLAAFRSTDPTVAAVDETGKARAEGFGESHVVVTYMRRHDLVRLVVPQPLPAQDPGKPPLFPEAPPANRIDELVLAKLRELGIQPSAPCTDAVFIRRVYLDVIGMLPPAHEVRAFIADRDPDKRRRLIDRLLERDELADLWAMRWGDLLRIKAEFPSNLWPLAAQAYGRWVRDAFRRNMPYDRFARELLESSGSNFRNPPVNFYRAFQKRDPQDLAEAAALVFLGVRIGCARCHGHPTESWTLDDNLGLAAFFAKVGYKATQEWKEEIVFSKAKGGLRHPVTGKPVSPAVPGGGALALGPDEDPRTRFADWLTAPENPWFARCIAIRLWSWLMGRGIVHEPDDLRPTNPPRNAALLEQLERELVGGGYDLKRLFRLILTSDTYQRSSRPNEWNAHDEDHFSHHRTQRLGAEQVSDAIGQVTGVWDRFSNRICEPFAVLPDGHRAVELADGSIGTPFLEMFGRPPRDTPYEVERSCETSLRQALWFINSAELEDRIARGPGLKRLLQSAKDDDGPIVEEAYLATLSRLPSDDEKKKVMEHLAKHKQTRAQAVHDVLWALVNAKEFLFVR